jgi:hypothetical protein
MKDCFIVPRTMVRVNGFYRLISIIRLCDESCDGKAAQSHLAILSSAASFWISAQVCSSAECRPVPAGGVTVAHAGRPQLAQSAGQIAPAMGKSVEL